MRKSTYERFPVVDVPNSADDCSSGWDAIGYRLKTELEQKRLLKGIVAVECYPGIDEVNLIEELTTRLCPSLVISTSASFLMPDEIDNLVSPFLNGDDPTFGFLTGLNLLSFFNHEKLRDTQLKVKSVPEGLILVVGCGATLFASPDMLIYADLSRWEAQLRFRRNESSNLGVDNKSHSASLQYKRAFFVDWRVADRWKRPLIKVCDFVLDTHQAESPKIALGDAVRRGLRHAVTRPFRVVPFFDPAPWGGQWMKEICNLDRSMVNFGWCFDCVPEENSLLFQFGNQTFEIPSINLVFNQPQSLLGDAVHARFGDEFPIRFDFLDTIKGGNLSLQVHPLTEYIQHHFGMHYTQDESYYMLDTEPDASVYLGLKNGIDPSQMEKELEMARLGGAPFNAEKYVNCYPAKKHDHFLIPAGTIHCSGGGGMVLEISATPYIFTFKMWDWSRLGLDGQPRPIHLEHAMANVQWDRTTDWVEKNLINCIQPVCSGDGWREEKTGLHEREFIETRRHWFTKQVLHYTDGGVNVINLIEGEEVIVESPSGSFNPFVVHYAETFIVPAAVGEYTIRPHGISVGKECATLKAFVRAGLIPNHSLPLMSNTLKAN